MFIMPGITIHNAYLAYKGTLLFDHLNLTIKPGKFTCLLGPSGVGKTTLLRIIADLIPTHEHLMTFRGDFSTEHKNNIAYLSQQDVLLPWLNALDNALLGAHLRGNKTAALLNKAKKLLAEVGLAKSENKYPYQLSGGMCQRIALIRTLLEEKSIILMDEPFSKIDAITRFELQALTVHLLKNRTIFFVTHDPMEALRIADEIIVLGGTPAKIHYQLTLETSTPRDFKDPALMQHYAELFHALTEAKKITA